VSQRELTASTSKLTQGSIPKTLLDLSIPMLWGILSIISFNIVDTYFIGQLGTIPLAAISFTFPVVLILGNIAFGLGIGASSVIARALGEGNREKVQTLTTHSLLLALVVVFFFLIIGLLTIDPLFTALGAKSDTLPLIHDYMEIWYLGAFFLIIPMVGNHAIRATGDTRIPALIMFISSLINILLDPLLIFGLAGFPRLEIQGAAIATVIARGVSLIFALSVLHFRKRLLIFKIPSVKSLIDSWKTILQVGLPAATTSLLNSITLSIATRLLAIYGTFAVAAFGVAFRVEGFALVVFMAFSASISPYVGQNWGAKKFDRVNKGIKYGFIFALFWGLVLTAFFALFSIPIVSVFNKTPEVIAIASTYLLILPISYGAQGIMMISNSSFNALGKALRSTICIFSKMILFVLYYFIIFKPFFGLYGVFISIALSNISIGFVSFVWTKKTIWKIS